MKNKKIFIVHDPGDLEPIEFLDAIFDSFEEAEAFTKRFKENSEFSITEKTVNPVYRTSKEVSPYYVKFDRDEFEPLLFFLNLSDHLAWIAHGNYIAWNVLAYDASRSYNRIVANCNSR